jgi:NADPH2:quinone reductase
MGQTSRQIRSKVTAAGQLQLSLATDELADPGPDELLVRVEAAPINPSDLGLLFGMADMTTAKSSGTAEDPVVVAEVPEGPLRGMQARFDQSLPVGNEGAGVVIAAGESAEAQAWVGKTVSMIGGAMYSTHRLLKVGQCLAQKEGTTPAEAASWFVNPMTALGMVETMRMEGHTALVHTAAASNLGQMLNKLCLSEGIDLVNVVRRPAQAELLRGQGAKHVVDSSEEAFMESLIEALQQTGATLAFDATGGGKLAGKILTAMEVAQTAAATEYSRYGSTVHKQVYIYGSLDRSPTVFNRAFGTAWGIGGWLLTPFLQKIGGEGVERLRNKVRDEIKTTFASAYTREVSLSEALSLDAIKAYGRQATGEKFLINPSR